MDNYYYNPLDYSHLPAGSGGGDDNDWLEGLRACILTIFWIILIVGIIAMCSGCTTTKYVPVIQHQVDTVQITKHQRDSIWLHDSIHVSEKQKGDTVWLELERWHTKYIEKATHDTTYVATHDTIPQPYPVPEYIEKQLSWWQRLRLHLGNIMLIIIGAAIVYGAAKLYLKFKPL